MPTPAENCTTVAAGNCTLWPPGLLSWLAVRLVLDQQREHESQWAAIDSMAGKIGCSAETLRMWVR